MKQAIPMKSFLVGRSKLTPGFLQVRIYLLERELPLTATLHQKLLPPPSSSQRTWNKKSGQVCCTNHLSNSNGLPTSTAYTRPVNCCQEYKEGSKGLNFSLVPSFRLKDPFCSTQVISISIGHGVASAAPATCKLLLTDAWAAFLISPGPPWKRDGAEEQALMGLCKGECMQWHYTCHFTMTPNLESEYINLL